MSKVNDLVAIARELDAELHLWSEDVEGGLPWVNPEVFGAWVSTIFINQNNQFKGQLTAAKAATDEVEGVIEKKGQKVNGDKTQYYLVINKVYYNAWDAKVFAGQKFAEGETVRIKFKTTDKGFKNIQSVEKLSEAADIPF